LRHANQSIAAPILRRKDLGVFAVIEKPVPLKNLFRSILEAFKT
jgi:hypothetical protein